jgi:opacity protein-like surface antigen
MKKAILLTSLAISSSASAIDQYYFRADVGGSYTPKKRTEIAGHKLQDSYDLFGNIGLGLHLNEYVRAEINYLMSMPIEQSSEGKSKKFPTEVDASEKHKISRSAIMLKFIPDFYDIGYGKLYGIFGIGLSNISDKITVDYSDDSAKQSVTTSAKKRTSPAYTIGLGGGFFLNSNALVDVSYSYSNYGKAKAARFEALGEKYEPTRVTLKSHELMMGIRYYF